MTWLNNFINWKDLDVIIQLLNIAFIMHRWNQGMYYRLLLFTKLDLITYAFCNIS